MSVTQAQLDRIHAAAKKRQSQGYFRRVEEGDQRAASLYARMIANDVNPTGKTTDAGWLSKVPPEANVDGWAEDSICGNADPNDVLNVVDLVNGAGASGANIPSRYSVDDLKPRRLHNRWTKPQPLTADEMDYLLDGGEPQPIPPPTPQYPSYEDLGGDQGGIAISRILDYDYRRAGLREGLDGDCGAWMQRVAYDYLVGNCKTVKESIDKHRAEWCQTLGINVP